MMYYTSSQSGFTLVEVLVAITILLLVVTGPMTIITSANRSNAFSTEQVQAFFFAQEGLELAQKGRDDLLLSYYEDIFASGSSAVQPFSTFLTDFDDCVSDGCGLTIANSGAIQITDCSDTTNCRLYRNTDTNARSQFIHGGVTDNATPYTRVITMVPIVGANGRIREVKVTSRVTWRTGSLIATQQVESVGYLFNIYDRE